MMVKTENRPRLQFKLNREVFTLKCGLGEIEEDVLEMRKEFLALMDMEDDINDIKIVDTWNEEDLNQCKIVDKE